MASYNLMPQRVLQDRSRAAVARLEACDICPRRCGANRLTDEDGVAVRGLLVRHLVLPGDAAGTGEVVRFLAEVISPTTYLNIMNQYRPMYHACRFPELCRSISGQEYTYALRLAAQAGLTRGLAIL